MNYRLHMVMDGVEDSSNICNNKTVADTQPENIHQSCYALRESSFFFLIHFGYDMQILYCIAFPYSHPFKWIGQLKRKFATTTKIISNWIPNNKLLYSSYSSFIALKCLKKIWSPNHDKITYCLLNKSFTTVSEWVN